MSGHTEGPWRWYGNTDTKNLYLGSPRNGRQIVMSFARYGMQDAKPLFPANGIMVGAEEMVRYEVCPDAESRDDERVYRADVSGIAHPNARILEASVDLFEAAEKALDLMDVDLPMGEEWDAVYEALHNAAKKAGGRS